MTDENAQYNPAAGLPYWDNINILDKTAPLRWLKKGWDDFRTAKMTSLIYGGLFFAVSHALTLGLYLAGLDYLIAPMIGGFLIVGPALAVGLYEVSRRISKGEDYSFGAVFAAWRRNQYHIMTAGLILMLFMMVWVRVSVLLFALMFPFVTLEASFIIEQAFTTLQGLTFVAIGTIIGAGFAGLAFITSVVSLPAMLDRKIDIFAASAISAIGFLKNLSTMILWGAMVFGIIGFGIVTGFVGLIIAFPVVAYASWHAYKEMVDLDR